MQTIAGRFELLDKLGEGAMAVVYRARDKVLGRPVAIKWFSSEVSSEDEHGQRFEREAEAVARLNHPNIAQVYDLGDADGRRYMVMELLEGGDLRSFIEKKAAFSVEEKVGILLQICEGLGFAHARGVIHRDIKPANVWLGPGGVVKLLDFGLARIANRAAITRRGFILGTPDYMSPEQAMGKELDHRSDIFSAGCLFYEFLGYQKPFKGKTFQSVLYKIISESPPPLRTLDAQVPEALAEVVHEMLTKEPEGRPQTMALVAERIRPFAPRPKATVRETKQPPAASTPPDPVSPGREGETVPTVSLGEVEGVKPGMVIAGRYELLSYRGRGSTGAVYKALDRTLEEEVAIKVLHADVAASPELARGFRTEIRLARRVSHRNVCRINEYGEDRGLVFISMEYVDGATFKQLLKKETQGIPTADALDLAIQSARGLTAIHDAGIVHRDLKPANIMKDTRGVVKLMDFGIAKLLGTTEAGHTVGTPAYMSPEQVLGQVADARSDVYALGLVIWELFTGRPAFAVSDPDATMFKRVQEELVPDEESGSRLPASVASILLKALRKAPSERFASAGELSDALRGVARSLLTSPSGSVGFGAPDPARPVPHSEEALAAARSAHEGDDADRQAPRPMADVTGLTSVLRAAVAGPRVSRSGLSTPGQSFKVFIAYRRDDSADIAGRIHDRLAASLGRTSVFKDVDSIPLGANYRDYLQTAVRGCLVLVAVVGKDWLEARDDQGRRRLDDPRDFLRIEIEAALEQDIPVIPLFVHGANMPDEKELPAGLEGFATQHGAAIRSDSNFNSDVKRLVAALKKLLAEAR